jgi:hypothetical protein
MSKKPWHDRHFSPRALYRNRVCLHSSSRRPFPHLLARIIQGSPRAWLADGARQIRRSDATVGLPRNRRGRKFHRLDLVGNTWARRNVLCPISPKSLLMRTLLAPISHKLATVTANASALTAFRSVGLLDRLHEYDCGASVAGLVRAAPSPSRYANL